MFETFVTVTGKVVSEPVRNHYASGDTKVSFRVMSVERRFNRDTSEWNDGDRLFLDVHCWRRLAEGVANSIVKGDNVVVLGRLHTRQYTTSGGDRREVYELDAKALGPDLTWCTVVVERPTRSAADIGAGTPGEELVEPRAA